MRDAVVDLVALLQAAQDRDGVLDRRLIDQDRLEAAFQGGVLLDVLAVLVERGGADAVQLAAGQHRLEQVAGVHGAFGLAGADDGVQLVDEQDDLALGFLHFLEHRLEPLLELAAVLGAGDQRAHVQGDDALVLQALPARRRGRCAGPGPSTMAVLPTPGSPISTGLFLVRRDSTWMTRRISSSRPMTGSSLPCRGQLGQVAAVAFQGLVGRFGVLRGDALVAAHFLQRRHQPVAGDAELLEQPAGRAAVVGHGQQQVLDGDVLVLEALGLVLGLGEQPVEPAGDVPTAGGRLGEPLQLLLDPASAGRR